MAEDWEKELTPGHEAADNWEGQLQEGHHEAAPPPHASLPEAILKGVQQLPAGFGDELGALEQAALLKASGDPSSFGDNYRKARDENRGETAQAAKDHPVGYYGTQLVGSAALAGLGGAAAAAKGAGVVGQAIGAAGRALAPVRLGKDAGVLARIGAGAANAIIPGALYGAGNSDADLTEGQGKQFAKDTAKGALLSGALGAGAAGVGAAVRGVNQFANAKVAAGLQRAEEMATKKAEEGIVSARGQAGSEIQKGSRLVENLLRAESTGELTSEQAAQLQALKNTGEWKKLVQGITSNNLESLPKQLGTIDAKKAALAELMAGKDATIQSEAARIASPSEAMRQIGDRAKRYLPRTIGAVAGKVLGTNEGPGLVEGQVLGPAVHALKRMANHPSVQVPTYKALATITRANPAALGKYGPVLSSALQNGGEAEFNAKHFVLSQSGDPDYQQMLGKLGDDQH